MRENARNNLLLTGPIGSGKSTAIAAALGEKISGAGGFLTVRQYGEDGRVTAFWLKRPDGSEGRVFLDCNAYTMHMEVFDSFGVELLQQARTFDYVILDEIGGFELLSDSFRNALMELLECETPCIGVMKGRGPAGRMIEKLGLGEHYLQKAEALRAWMLQNENTLLYECSRFDPESLRLAQEWVSCYCK